MGAASARAFAREGAAVVVADLDGAQAEQTTRQIVEQGGSALAVEVDVRDANAVANMVRQTVDTFETVDILACIAGVLQPTAVDDISEEEWRLVVDVNLTGVFLCAQAVLPIMKEKRFGKIVIMGSMAGRATSTLGGAHYTASKAAVLGFMRHLARETAPFELNVNAINPGIIDTGMIEATTTEESLRGVINGIPFGRMGTPEEVADSVLFLSSDASRYITGAAIDIHGGEVII